MERILLPGRKRLSRLLPVLAAEVQEMGKTFGIRIEDKSRWERRSPLVPGDLNELIERTGVSFVVQPSRIRIFSDEQYRAAGAELLEDLSGCDVILAIKEVPTRLIMPHKTYVFFSHTVKGQAKNMPMLRRLMELGCQLIDYEKVVDSGGRRLIFFGPYAGRAGMLDSLWALGRRLEWEGLETGFSGLQPTHRYGSLEAVGRALAVVAEEIKERGLPEEICPLVVGFAGYGNVSRGAQEMLSHLPTVEVEPGDLPRLGSGSSRTIYKVVFKEEHMARPLEANRPFQLQEYYDHPERFGPCFEEHLPHLTVLMNCIYWQERYPRLVSWDALQQLYSAPAPRLRVIGDVSCDIEGAIQCMVKVAQPDSPVYTCNPDTREHVDGWEGHGPVVLAVDNLPCELPRESSETFSGVLKEYLPALARADFALPFEELDLPPELKAALILHRGELTPRYQYLADALYRHEAAGEE